MEVQNDFHDTQTIQHVCCEFVKNRNENANVATDWFFFFQLYARRLSNGTEGEGSWRLLSHKVLALYSLYWNSLHDNRRQPVFFRYTLVSVIGFI